MAEAEAALELAVAWLKEAKRVVAFTGAGVSQESGIPTFRDGGGLWREFSPERFATAQGLLETATRDPTEVARFLLAVLEPIAVAQPNPAHRALASLEAHVRLDVVTQNIDGLHQEAGNQIVHEIHGSMLEVGGAGGQRVRSLSRAQLREVVAALKSAMSARLFKLPRLLRAMRPLVGLGAGVIQRPRVVMFGEPLQEPDWRHAQEAAARCDLMLVIGTSGAVWPAATLPDEALAVGAKVVGVNPDAGDADVWLQGSAGTWLPRLVSGAFGS